MLTVDFDRLPLRPGERVLDLGCGAGRHAFECYRRGARVVALDRCATDLADVRKMFWAMREAGEAGDRAEPIAVRGDALRLPFPDGAFDVVIAAEILEHVPADRAAIAEASRVLRPGGRLVVTVPRWWPERICWALSEAYHRVEGGHVRVYRRGRLRSKLRAAGLVPLGSHHAHALHSPYWWLRCLFGVDNERATLPRLYHRVLVHDLTYRPWWTVWPEKLLNPLLGKSLVIYLRKPDRAG
nr:methyltransferase domain-containing protein [Micromonospora sp. DSM 115978]